MKTKSVILWLVILCFSTLLGCSLPKEIATETNSTTPEVELKGKWDGTGIKTTGIFTIDKTPWGIIWTNKPKTYNGESIGVLQIYVYNAKTNELITVAANTGEREVDNSYVYQAGTFYLEINGVNTSWEVEVWGAK